MTDPNPGAERSPPTARGLVAGLVARRKTVPAGATNARPSAPTRGLRPFQVVGDRAGGRTGAR